MGHIDWIDNEVVSACQSLRASTVRHDVKVGNNRKKPVAQEAWIP